METGLLPSPSTAPLLHGPKKRTYFSVYHHSLFFYKRAAKGFSDKPRYPSILWTAWHTAHLAERCHEGGYLAVVGCIHVGSSLDQQLHHIKVATVSSEPQRGVPLLISHVNVSPSTLTERKDQHETLHSGGRTDWYCTLPVLQNIPADEKLTKLVVALVCSNGEGGVTRGGNWRGIDIRPFIQQNTAHFSITARRSLHERGEASLVEEKVPLPLKLILR